MWTPATSDGRESRKIRFELVPYTRGRGLDVGCGVEKVYPHAIGVDNNVDERLFGYRTIADVIVPTAEDLGIFATEGFRWVFSSHLLEHIKEYRAALAEWFRLVEGGGHLILYLPHKKFYPNIGTPGANPDHKHDFVPEDIVKAMEQCGSSWDLLVNEERNDDDEYSFLQVYRKRLASEPMGHGYPYKDPRPLRRAAVIRYGAYGDVLQTSSVLPGLKKQGYHVTFFCTPRAHEAIAYDPHIDSFVIQDEDQVPNAWLGDFFRTLEKRYDRVVNLCGSVEDCLLPDPARAHHYWPKEARHIYCNHNYVEMNHAIAQVPYDGPRTRFYPTDEERAQALERRASCNGPVICWSLSGSAPHKIWPFVDNVVASILLCLPDATIVMLGSAQESPLCDDWRNEPRIWNRCGVWSIREALAFVQLSDIVIGPETGVLNAVAMEDCAKVLILSHSTVENLCRDWKRTIALAAEGVSCYPCHRLHTDGWKWCNRHPDGGAACQVAITPDIVWAAVRDALSDKLGIAIPEEPPKEVKLAIAR